MAPLICPSPIILDQSFPRDTRTLDLVAIALGNLQSRIESGDIAVVLTPALQLFVEDFDWATIATYPDLHDLYRLMVQWFLQPHESLILIDLDVIQGCGDHPIPSDCERRGNVELWSHEVRKLLEVHDSTIKDAQFYIGVACHRAFGGEKLGRYDQDSPRALPLVGPANLAELKDAYEWIIDQHTIKSALTFESAKKNVFVLGATKIRKPQRGSHYQVTFPGGCRSWPLDYNEDPVKDNFTKELVEITGFPFEVIKTVLITGSFPPKSIRLWQSALLHQPTR